MSTTEEEVGKFLDDFKQKMEVFDVVFLDRKKNFQTLLDLEIVRASRKEILNELVVKDFFRGPSQDQFGGADLWEFGKKIKGKEVYIKITIGDINKPVICISFHLAEYKIKYPFKI
ncbi:MAG: hypothetical protein ACNS60_20520 [Candidatus Cyclobacteriaceae bacterium M2_1C_046]